MEIHVNSFTLAYFAHGWTWVWLFATAACYAAQAGAKVHPATCDIHPTGHRETPLRGSNFSFVWLF